MIATLWTLARPKGMALVALLPLIGISFAYWDHGCTVPGFAAFPHLFFLALLWAVPHMGTMWLNAALDRDEGPVLWGKSVPVPAGIEKYAYATLAAAVWVAFAVHRGLGACVLGCAILSVLYSHPRTAWKKHPLLGPFANALGYGILSPLGGWIYAGVPPTLRGALVLGIGVAFVLAAYLGAQAFQEKEDRARGDRTPVVVCGPRLTLDLARALFAVGAALAIGFAALGWFPRTVLLAAPAFWMIDRHLVRWRRHPEGGDVTWAAGFFRRLVFTGLFCFAAISLHYRWQERAGGPLGGLGTAAGHPAVRICGELGGPRPIPVEWWGRRFDKKPH